MPPHDAGIANPFLLYPDIPLLPDLSWDRADLNPCTIGKSRVIYCVSINPNNRVDDIMSTMALEEKSIIR